MSITSEDSYDFASDSSDGEEAYLQMLSGQVPPKIQAVLGMKSQSSKTAKKSKTKSSNKPTFGERMAFLFVMGLLGFGVFFFTGGQKHQSQAQRVSYTVQFETDAYQGEAKYDQGARQERMLLKIAETINKALEKFNNMTEDKQLMINKWISVPEKFNGLKEYLQETGRTGTFHDDFMHLARPNFNVKENGTITIGFRHDSFAEMEKNWTPRQNDSQPSDETRIIKIINNAHLNITDIINKNGKKMIFTRVYRIPLKDLIKLV